MTREEQAERTRAEMDAGMRYVRWVRLCGVLGERIKSTFMDFTVGGGFSSVRVSIDGVEIHREERQHFPSQELLDMLLVFT